MELHAKVTVFAEGCRGHLGKQLINKFELNKGKDPQQYGIGFKEIWEINDEKHEEGMVMHTVKESLNKLDTERSNLVAQHHAISGAIQQCDLFLSELKVVPEDTGSSIPKKKG